MGRPDIARIKRDAEVAAAEADRDIAIKRAEATRASAVPSGKPIRNAWQRKLLR